MTGLWIFLKVITKLARFGRATRIRPLKLANTQTEGQKQITYPQNARGIITKLIVLEGGTLQMQNNVIAVIHVPREHWMIYKGPCFLAII